ncbi:MAG: hypothetical protein JWN98_1969 [Abditibacteriota bacterium]|jgi:CheY-like chemotaxis protein|nr:hypothetical protein [Abditibacteriota bacterium]
MKILFAEDSVDTRFLYQMAFQIAGHEVHLASDGFEAVVAFREQDVDIVLLDLDMPGLSGWDAIRAIRQTEKGRDIPIVIFSAYYAPKYADRVQQERVDMVIAKPIMPDELTQRLERIIEASRAAASAASTGVAIESSDEA